MGAVSELLVLLEKIPQWKRLMELPSRIEAIEKRIADIEKRMAGGGDVCPKCRAMTFTLISSTPNRDFGHAGVHDRLYRCSQCSFEEVKVV